MVSPVNIDPFTGLQQGLQIQQQLMGSIYSPQKLQTESEILREKLATSQLQREQAQQALTADERELEINQARLIGSMAKFIQEQPEDTWQSYGPALERVLGEPVPEGFLTPEGLRVASDVESAIGNYFKEKDPSQAKITKGEIAKYRDPVTGNDWEIATTYVDGKPERTAINLSTGKVGDPPQNLERVSDVTDMTRSEDLEHRSKIAAETAKGAALGKRRDAISEEYRKGAITSAKVLRQASQLRGLMKSFGEGKVAQVMRQAAQIFPIFRDADEESFLSISNQLILSQRSDLLGGGVLSDGDLALLRSIGAQIGNSVPGNEQILAFMEEAARISQENSRRFDEWVANGNNEEDFRETLQPQLDASLLDIPVQQPSTPAQAPVSGRLRDRRKREQELMERFNRDFPAGGS